MRAGQNRPAGTRKRQREGKADATSTQQSAKQETEKETGRAPTALVWGREEEREGVKKSRSEGPKKERQ